MTETAGTVDRNDRGGPWFAWMAVFSTAWILGGVLVIVWGLGHGAGRDVLQTVYAVPLYVGLATLGVLCVVLVVRAVRSERRWYQAFPPGYGSTGAGLLVIVVWLVADVGWREGVGIAQEGIENWVAPTRVVLWIGLFLVAIAPLRANLALPEARMGRWPAVLSAGFALSVAWGAGFHPAVNPWLEHTVIDFNSEIWAMDEDGRHQTRLIESGDGLAANSPALSPDGTKIAYSRMRLGDHPPVDVVDDSDIWVMNADGSDSHPLVERPEFQWLPHWSPDGVWILYTDEPEGGPWESTGPRGPEGGNGLFGLAFSPGSAAPLRRYAQIWRVRADGTESPERLGDTGALGDDRAAAYSPDGTQIVFDSYRDGNTQIYLMDPNGGNQRRVTRDESDDWGATWSPDGRQIAFNAAFTGDMQIYVLGVDGNPPVAPIQVTSGPGGAITPSWSPDGSRLAVAYQRVTGPTNDCEIRSVTNSGGDVRDLTRTPGACEDLTSGGGAWGPDGRIVYSSGEAPAARRNPLVSEDLAAATVLFTAILLAVFAAVLVRIDPPFGAFAVFLGLAMALPAVGGDAWRFIPATVAGGLVVDVLLRFTSDGRTGRVAAAGSSIVFVLGLAATVSMGAGIGWSPTLLLGVVTAAGVLGWGIGAVVGARREGPPEAQPDLPG